MAGDEDEAQLFFTKTREALEIIREGDPHRWTRIQRQLRRIVLINGGGQIYHRELSAYVVDLPTFRIHSALEFASTVVHEATHARLHQRGIGYNPSLRTRIETLCVGEEIAFLKRIPGTEALIEKKRSSLGTPWWSDEAMHQRRLQQLRSARIPRFILHVYDRVRNFRKRL